MDRAAAEPVTVDLAAFIADPWSPAGLNVVDDLTRAGHFGGLVRVVGHGVPATLDVALHEHAALEVAHGEQWEPVAVVPGGYVVLFGTQLERVSRGYLRATTHRVRERLPGHGHHVVACRVVACRLSLPPGSDIDPLRLPPPLDRRAAGRDPVVDDRADQA